jgi:isoquinoline 1-oxidoreductase subunit alpha
LLSAWRRRPRQTFEQAAQFSETPGSWAGVLWTGADSISRSCHFHIRIETSWLQDSARRATEGLPPRRTPPLAWRLTGGLHMAALSVNGTTHQVDVDPNTPLLWVLRDTIGLTGTKYGCGIAQCGACTVHVDGIAMRSCSVPLSAVDGKKITTIEGLAQNGALHKVQQAWLEHDVPQCGYCQCGIIMAVAALLKDKPKPTDADIDANITNICRCGTFQQVRTAIHAAANA